MSIRVTDRELLKRSSLSLVQVKRGRGAALGLHSITTRPSLAPRSCFFKGLNSKVGAQAKRTGSGYMTGTPILLLIQVPPSTGLRSNWTLQSSTRI